MPADLHPGRDELGRFVDGTLEPEGNRRVVRHLLAGCEPCRRATAEFWRPAEAASPRARVRDLGAFERRRAEIEAERAAAPKLLEELDGQPVSRQLLLVLNSRRFHNWFLCEALLERAFEIGLSNPSEAIPVAEIGTALSSRLVETEPEESVNHDLLARSWAVLGNARRVNSQLDEAQQAFSRACAALEQGSGDPQEEGDVWLLLGQLHHDRRHFGEAVACFDRAVRLFRMVGDQHLVGKALGDKARSAGEAGDSDTMIELLRQAVSLLDDDRDPRLLFAAQHNLTWALKESGRLDEALATLQEILPLHARSARVMDLLRLRWLEGKLAQAQGELERAEAAFREVQEGFVSRRVPYDAALASLDLAAVLYERGEIGEMKRLAADSLPVFRALGIDREALAALALYERAVRRERVSLRWIAELVAYLQRARSDPGLSFEPAALPT